MMANRGVLCALVVCVCFGGLALAQRESKPAITPQTAAEVFSARKYEEAARQYRHLVEHGQASADTWFRLGFSLQALGKFEDAIEAFLEVERFDPTPLSAIANYNIACAQARLGRTNQALVALERAAGKGFADVSLMTSDSDLEPLRRDDRWTGLVERVKANRSASPRRQFDFWVGEWDVYDPDGNKVGENIITLRQNGMMVHESWTGAQGGRGESVNFYDPQRRTWRQLWVDARGGVVEYEGTFENGAMRMTGRRTSAEGQTMMARALFEELPDGRVRQFLEESSDGGETWGVYFEGYYVRR